MKRIWVYISFTDVVLVELLATLAENGISEGEENRLVLSSSAKADPSSRGVAGDGLWALEAWVTPDVTTNVRYAVQSQILNSVQSGKTLNPGASLLFGDVAYTHDLTDVTCEQAKNLCVQLMKGPAPTADFNLIASPNPSVLKVCNPLKCSGMQGFFFWFVCFCLRDCENINVNLTINNLIFT